MVRTGSTPLGCQAPSYNRSSGGERRKTVRRFRFESHTLYLSRVDIADNDSPASVGGAGEAPEWIRTERTSPQTWLVFSVSLAFVLGAVYVLATGGLGVVAGVPAWLIPSVALLAAFWAIQLYVLNVQRPRAIRLTTASIEVRTLFGGLVRVPRDSAIIRPSWPSDFGNLRSPTLPAWVGLSPKQLSFLWRELHLP